MDEFNSHILSTYKQWWEMCVSNIEEMEEPKVIIIHKVLIYIRHLDTKYS